MGRPKELSTCAICGDDTPAITRIEYQGQQVPVCNMHRSRIYRYGAKDTVRWHFSDEKNLRKLLDLVVAQGMTYRAALEHLPKSSAGNLTKVLRLWRQDILDANERKRVSQAALAEYWELPLKPLRAQLELARRERDEGVKPK